MPVVLGAVLLMIGLVLLAWTRMVKRWKRMATLSDGSVRRHFNPYTDIDWDAPKFSITQNDPRSVLPAIDPVGRHSWYKAQPLEKQIAIGMWRQANVAKVSLHLASIPFS